MFYIGGGLFSVTCMYKKISTSVISILCMHVKKHVIPIDGGKGGPSHFQVFILCPRPPPHSYMTNGSPPSHFDLTSSAYVIIHNHAYAYFLRGRIEISEVEICAIGCRNG